MRPSISPLHPLLLGLSLALLIPSSAAAQAFDWGAGVRPRFEARDVDGVGNAIFTSMRTRLDLSRSLGSDLRIFVQLQDARLWGEEAGVGDGSAERFDVHQAFLEIGRLSKGAAAVRVGRQEAEWAEGRLVGIPVWSQVGNAYDGVRASFRLGERGSVDLFGFQIREAESALHETDESLLGAWAEVPVGTHSLQLFALHDREGSEAGTRRTTFGGYYLGATRGVSYRVEGALQRGELTGADLEAGMLAARVTVPLVPERADATLWYDRYSGDAEALETDGVPTGAFDDLFGRNHRFFGFADLFGDLPRDTQGRGIQDLALKFGWDLRTGGRVGLDLHRFLVSDDVGLDEATLADEVDLWVRLEAMTGLNVLGGLSWVGAGDAGRALGAVPGDQLFGYVQLHASF